MKKFILLIGIVCCSHLVNAQTVDPKNTEVLGKILGDVSFMATAEAELAKSMPDRMSLNVVKWAMTAGGSRTGKMEYKFTLEYDNFMYSGISPRKKCQILVTYTEYLNNDPSTKNYETSCLQ